MAGDRILITVAEGHGDRLDELVTRLEGAGASVEKVLRAIGVIVARCPAARRTALAGLDGVGAVEDDREVRLDPPDRPQ